MCDGTVAVLAPGAGHERTLPRGAGLVTAPSASAAAYQLRGPVYISGKGSCIDWSGAIGPAPEQYVIRYATNCG